MGRKMTETTDDIFFEDVVPGAVLRAGPYVIPEDELVGFAAAWDPMPIHVDKDYAIQHGGLTASGTYLFAIRIRLIHTLPLQRSVIASAGWDKVRFHRPAHPGDALTLELTWRDKRRSQSKPDRGVVTGHYALIDGSGEPVMSYIDTVLMRLRHPDSPGQ